MLRSKRSEFLTAAVLMAPFVVIYGVMFVYPTIRMAQQSFTNAPLIGPGKWVGFDNYVRLASDRLFSLRDLEHRLFRRALGHPQHRDRSCGRARRQSFQGLGAERRAGGLLSALTSCRCRSSFAIWSWIFDKDFGIAQYVIAPFNDGHRISIFRTIPLFMPAVAFVTVWWLLGFNVLLFIAGLRNISSEIYEAAELDGAELAPSSRRITWPLIWPVTVLVFTIQLILQLKIFDQVYLFAARRPGRRDHGDGPVHLQEAFQMNKGGLADAAALLLFLLIVVLSVLQFQLLRARGVR